MTNLRNETVEGKISQATPKAKDENAKKFDTIDDESIELSTDRDAK